MVYTIHSMLYTTPIYWNIGVPVVYHMVYTICMDHSLSLQAKLSQRLLGRLSFTGASDSQAVRLDKAYFIRDS